MSIRPAPTALVALALVLSFGACAPRDADLRGEPGADPRDVSLREPEGQPSERTSKPHPSRYPSATPGPTRVTPSPTPPVAMEGDELPGGLLGEEWYSLPTEDKVVALTFDCGSNADGIPRILETLSEEKARATFFLTGNWSESFPRKTARIGSRFAVGNHTNTHPDLTGLNRVDIRHEVQAAARHIIRSAGVDPRPLFRFPYGASDERTLGVVNELGYGSIRWTIDTLGWKGRDAGITRRVIVRRVMEGLRPGAIVLMHVGSAPDGSTLDAGALPKVIERIREAGYHFVRLDRSFSSLAGERG